VLILIDNGVEDSEFIYPYFRFQEEGYRVLSCRHRADETRMGKHCVSLKSDLLPEEVTLEEFDAIVIPGGRAPDIMCANKMLVEVV